MLEAKEKYSNQVIVTGRLGAEVDKFIQSGNVSKIVVFTQDKIKNDISWVHNISDQVVMLSDGEGAKDISSVIDSINYLAQIKADRNTLLIAFGGPWAKLNQAMIASLQSVIVRPSVSYPKHTRVA